MPEWWGEYLFGAGRWPDWLRSFAARIGLEVRKGGEVS